MPEVLNRGYRVIPSNDISSQLACALSNAILHDGSFPEVLTHKGHVSYMKVGVQKYGRVRLGG